MVQCVLGNCCTLTFLILGIFLFSTALAVRIYIVVRCMCISQHFWEGYMAYVIVVSCMLVFRLVLSISECERWRRTDNVSAENGVFYPLSSVADCMELCISQPSCVAVDIWSDSCSLHLDARDLLATRVAIGVSHFVFDRSCVVSTASTTSSETVFTTPLTATGF